MSCTTSSQHQSCAVPSSSYDHYNDSITINQAINHSMMIASTRIGRSILARTTATGIASARTTKKSVSATRHLTSNQKNHPSILHLQYTTHNQPFAHSSSLLSTNNFSTAVVTDDKAEFIRRIKSDLADADIKKDGRIDSDELKLILKKYSDAFYG